MTSQRLLQNIARQVGIIEQNKMNIARLEGIIEQNKMNIARLEGIIEQNKIKQQAELVGTAG